jgi:hypothetical protein
MEYFSSFPKIEYNKTSITDITKRIDFFEKIKDNLSIYSFYVIKDNERPEDVAYKFYKDPNLYWIILYINNIININKDWIMNNELLLKYCSDKYGANNVYAIHHYETNAQSELGEGVLVNSGSPFSFSVTNFDYENNINERKREIKILKPEYIKQVVNEYRDIFKK